MSGLLAAGHKVTATDLAMLADSDTQNTSGTTTSTSYTATLTGGTACGKAFVAPPSGKVLIINNCYFFHSAASFAFCTIRLKTGASIGSGTDVIAAADAECLVTGGVSSQGRGRLVTGLTAGSSYNVQQMFRVDTSGTGTFVNKQLIVIPQLA